MLFEKIVGILHFRVDTECDRTPEALARMCRLLYAPNVAFLLASIISKHKLADVIFALVLFLGSLVFVTLAHFVHHIGNLKLKKEKYKESAPLAPEGLEVSVQSESVDSKADLGLLWVGYVLITLSIITFVVGAWDIVISSVF